MAFAVFSSPPPDTVSAAPPLLCINGGMLYGHSMLWPALSPLARRRQLILYDQRGRGETPAPDAGAPPTIEDDAADVGALRRALGVRHWDVLGHSWGGGIAFLAAAMDPAGTRRLVTVDAVGPTSSWMAPVRERALSRLAPAERAELERFDDGTLARPDPEVQAAFSRAMYPAWFADPELARSFAPPRVTSQTGASILAGLRRDGYDWRPQMRALSVPTLVLHGEEDALPISAAAEWAALLPHAQHVVIPNSGHMPFWEAPEPFFSLVDSFLGALHPGVASRPV